MVLNSACSSVHQRKHVTQLTEESMVLSSSWYSAQHVPQITEENMLLRSPKKACYSAQHVTQLSIFLSSPKKICYSADWRRETCYSREWERYKSSSSSIFHILVLCKIGEYNSGHSIRRSFHFIPRTRLHTWRHMVQSQRCASPAPGIGWLGNQPPQD